jgi:two-component system, NarL family, nitrate/nitrite response regulator NarL
LVYGFGPGDLVASVRKAIHGERFGSPASPDTEEDTIDTGPSPASGAQFKFGIGEGKESRDRMPAPATIRLVLAGFETLLLSRLQRIFGQEKDFEVIACCGKGEDVLFTVSALYPDILVFDLPPAAVSDGLELVRQMRARELPTRVVLLSAPLKEDDLQEAVRLGVRAVVPRDVATAALLHCTYDVHGGDLRSRARPAGWSFPAARNPDAALRSEIRALTPREVEVVRLVCVGLRNRQIAARLSVKEGTVKTHLHRIYEKLTVRSRLELSIYGRNLPSEFPSHDAGRRAP